MKVVNSFLLLLFCSIVLFSCKKDDTTTPPPRFGTKDAAGRIIISGEIKENVTLVAAEKYILKGYVYVTDGFTLTIPAGTIIFGDKTLFEDKKGCLIVEKGGKLVAEGTATKPIIFTSSQPKGSRAYGDWGGIVLIGKGATNQPSSTTFEGGIRGEYGTYDAVNANDNSGSLKYVRIEFAGVALSTVANSEINGLTMYGVGSGTKIQYIQVSYSGDDSYEWFGGNVNCKYLIAHRGFDDDWDTDHGFSGKIQFGVSLRDKRVADQSSSNGFESDNDANSSTRTPLTAAIFANMSNYVDDVLPSNAIIDGSGRYQAAMHIRRNTSISIFNSLMVGYPQGLRLDGASTTLVNANNGGIELKGNVLANCTLPYAGAGSVTDQQANDFFSVVASGNSVTSLANLADLKLNANAFNLTAPNFVPQTGSPLLANANWTGKGADVFFEKVAYRGAFGTTDWTTSWTNFNPQNTDY